MKRQYKIFFARKAWKTFLTLTSSVISSLKVSQNECSIFVTRRVSLLMYVSTLYTYPLTSIRLRDIMFHTYGLAQVLIFFFTLSSLSLFLLIDHPSALRFRRLGIKKIYEGNCAFTRCVSMLFGGGILCDIKYTRM